jgi:hypothetical protein
MTRRHRAAHRSLYVLLCSTLAACSDASGGAASVSRETVGDTTFVRVSGAAPELDAVEELRIGQLDGPEEYTIGNVEGVAVAEDGGIYVLDAQARTIRVFDAAGRHVRTIGRSGEGPGELKQPGGMLFDRAGRLIVRDAGNARMNVYSAEGETITTWPIPGGFFTSSPVYGDVDGNVYTDIIAARNEDGSWKVGLLRLDEDGTVVDTLIRPFGDYSPPALRAERVSGQNRSMSMSNVPFWPSAYSALNRTGEFVGGIADRYALTVWRRDGTELRIERDTPPVAVQQAEADAAVERTTRSMRNLDENWKWDAPRPPANKPAFSDVRVAEDDRIWVRVPRPGVRQEPDPDARPDDRGRMPVAVWAEPLVYEVFEPDGTLIGAVRLPDRFRLWTMRGNSAWGVQRDELDVQYIVRLRVLP